MNGRMYTFHFNLYLGVLLPLKSMGLQDKGSFIACVFTGTPSSLVQCAFKEDQ